MSAIPHTGQENSPPPLTKKDTGVTYPRDAESPATSRLPGFGLTARRRPRERGLSGGRPRDGSGF
jgi:hypothetical protein